MKLWGHIDLKNKKICGFICRFNDFLKFNITDKVLKMKIG